MSDIHFRVWHKLEKKMYYRGYQKVSHILICDDDLGTNAGQGKPMKDASYEDCELLQGTEVYDCQDREIFEGDILEIRMANFCKKAIVEQIPDMYKSRNIHPLISALSKVGLTGEEEDISFLIMGNIYESPMSDYEWT